MFISQHFKLHRTQATLDFVDVDVRNDLPLFIDPHAIEQLGTQWGDECVALIHDFFEHILHLIANGSHQDAQRLLRHLTEPRETHLGLSRRGVRGRAVGGGLATEFWSALRRSEAVHTGLLRDLEDTLLLIEGVGDDIVSDITTNLIREPLIEYTQRMCRMYGISMTPDVGSRFLWNPAKKSFSQRQVELPIVHGDRLLLVPKIIVRQIMEYDAGDYHRNYILERLREVELSANSSLVEVLKNGKTRVTKEKLIEKYGKGKRAILSATLEHPDVLDEYRYDKLQKPRGPLTHQDFAEVENTPPVDWPALFRAVRMVAAGNDHASAFHRAVADLLNALFYPALVNPRLEEAIHQGRKRIDIVYDNVGDSGFFGWVRRHYPAATIVIECKNYSTDPKNPELDQIAGRFSPQRGQVGLLVCRHFEKKKLFIERCRDTAKEERGFVIPIDDGDLNALIEARLRGNDLIAFPLLRERFGELIQ